jgi:hypothetical protein
VSFQSRDWKPGHLCGREITLARETEFTLNRRPGFRSCSASTSLANFPSHNPAAPVPSRQPVREERVCRWLPAGGMQCPDNANAAEHYSAWWRCAFGSSHRDRSLKIEVVRSATFHLVAFVKFADVTRSLLPVSPFHF